MISTILWVCLTIVVVIFTVIVLIAFIEALYLKINSKKIQQKRAEEISENIHEFITAIDELRNLTEKEETPKKKTTTKKTTKKKETK